jgi:hypothetical protein
MAFLERLKQEREAERRQAEQARPTGIDPSRARFLEELRINALRVRALKRSIVPQKARQMAKLLHSGTYGEEEVYIYPPTSATFLDKLFNSPLTGVAGVDWWDDDYHNKLTIQGREEGGVIVGGISLSAEEANDVVKVDQALEYGYYHPTESYQPQSDDYSD